MLSETVREEESEDVNILIFFLSKFLSLRETFFNPFETTTGWEASTFDDSSKCSAASEMLSNFWKKYDNFNTRNKDDVLKFVMFVFLLNRKEAFKFGNSIKV